jgi:hypothetical protein
LRAGTDVVRVPGWCARFRRARNARSEGLPFGLRAAFAKSGFDTPSPRLQFEDLRW